MSDDDAFTLTVLGCSGSYAGPGEACSGYLLRAGGRAVWLDAGPGTLAALQEHVALGDLDAIVLTHSHPDHWVELPVARNALKYILGRDAMPVYGTAETRSLATTISGTLEPTLVWTTIRDGSDVDVAGMRVRCSRTDHPVETLAIRVDHAGRSLAFSADTGPGWSLSALGSGIDLFLCEASLSSADEGRVQHLTGAQAGVIARDGGVARLVLTHLVPGVDPEAQRADAAATFASPVEVARAHVTYDI